LLPSKKKLLLKQQVDLYLPDKAAEKPKVAKVLKVGKSVKDIKVGDKIVYKAYSTTELKLDGTEYMLKKRMC
jgi:co-chaperonin GroES (HSP10)